MKSPANHQPDETNMTLHKLVRRSFVAIMALMLLLFGSAGGALAHDAVTGTSPADGSTVGSLPNEVQISLTNTPAVIGSEVQVLDASGTNWATGRVDVLDKVATQHVRTGAPAGSYTVKWRLVSSDAHPIEGEFSFTSTAASTATAGQAVVVGPEISVSPQPQSTTEIAQNSNTAPWAIIGMVVVLLGIVVALVVLARRRLNKED